MQLLKLHAALALALLLGGAGSALAAVQSPWTLQHQLKAIGEGKRLRQPLAVTLDPSQGRYIVADGASGALVSFDMKGTYVAALGGGDRLETPVALARTKSGKFWVVNRAGNQLFYIDPAQREARAFSPTQIAGRPALADRVAVEGSALFLLDRLRGVVLQIDDDLKVVREFKGPRGYLGFVDFKLRQGRLWALDALGRTVHVFDRKGKLDRSIALQEKDLQFPVSLEVDDAGRLYVLDRHAGSVAVFDPQGRFQYGFLSRGKGRGEIWYPSQILFDWENRLLVVDEGNGKVEVYARR